MEAVDRLEPTDPLPEHVISPQDRPQVIVISGIYELPLGKGKPWLNSSRWLDRAVGGWTMQGIYRGQSGPPLEFGNIIFYGNIKDIPLPVGQRTVDEWFNFDAGFERASGKQLAQNIQTFPARLNNVRGDGFNNLSLSVMKNIRIRERLRLQLRAEAVDALKSPDVRGAEHGPDQPELRQSDRGRVGPAAPDLGGREATVLKISRQSSVVSYQFRALKTDN
jgi:hypothetical protein